MVKQKKAQIDCLFCPNHHQIIVIKVLREAFFSHQLKSFLYSDSDLMLHDLIHQN